MKKIELTRAYVDGNTIRYEIREDSGLGLLQQERVELFIQYHFNETFDCELSVLPPSILMLPISLYMIPITCFCNVELVIPEMDEDLYSRLPQINSVYSKLYGPFKEGHQGKVTVKQIVKNSFSGTPKYDKIVFFSGGVDACHAGIGNPGVRSLLVSVPDIEIYSKNKGPLRDVKFSLIKNFSKIVGSDWLLVSNNFNACFAQNQEVDRWLAEARDMSVPARITDGWAGIRYIPNMCCIAPIAYLTGVKSLIMGSGCLEIEGKYEENLDGANPAITNAMTFAGVSFAEQDGLYSRRSMKVKEIISWCKAHDKRVKLWVCFSDSTAQCGFCGKCVRTQLNVLCEGENPRDWGFDAFSENRLAKCIRDYQYREGHACFLWDIIETIEDRRVYPYLNGLLHWLKKVGYKEYIHRVEKRKKPTRLKRALSIRRYPHYAKVVVLKLFGRYGK